MKLLIAYIIVALAVWQSAAYETFHLPPDPHDWGFSDRRPTIRPPPLPPRPRDLEGRIENLRVRYNPPPNDPSRDYVQRIAGLVRDGPLRSGPAHIGVHTPIIGSMDIGPAHIGLNPPLTAPVGSGPAHIGTHTPLTGPMHSEPLHSGPPHRGPSHGDLVHIDPLHSGPRRNGPWLLGYNTDDSGEVRRNDSVNSLYALRDLQNLLEEEENDKEEMMATTLETTTMETMETTESSETTTGTEDYYELSDRSQQLPSAVVASLLGR